MPAKKKKTAAKKKLPRRVKVTDKAVAQMSEGERIERAQHLETIHLPKSVMTLERDIARGKVKMGRPSDYTPRIVENLLRFVAAGLPLERAAAAAGVNTDTLYDWKKKFPDFSECIAHAESQYANLCHITINEQIVNGDGHLALKTLQSRFSKDYSTSKKVEMQTMSFSSTISPEQLLEMQQQRNALDSSSDYESNVIDVDTKDSEGSSTVLGTVFSQPEQEGGSPTGGEGDDNAPHPPPYPRTLEYSPPSSDPIEADSRLYCPQCAQVKEVQQVEVLGSRRDAENQYAQFNCSCGYQGESVVIGG